MGKSRDENTRDDFPDIEAQPVVETQHFDLFEAEPAGREASSNRRIGRYRLIRPIGEGGMGVVWRAIQEHPVRRDVALKLVRKDVGNDALARFDAERQAIAMMDHPNIARILDADTTDDGAPYFVMELVKGVPLDQYCNNRRLGIEERLRLMLPICRAVQHAHQKAIIHRDIKHSNILVAENDDEAIPKVIDFGLAKALGSQKVLSDNTIFTEFGKVVGTIYYMSPEQADTDSGMDIDTRSDIYSLGVVLYKLLTGRTPIQMEGEGLSVIGAIKVIRDKDPVPPSVAAGSHDDCRAWVTDSTPGDPRRHADQLKGDLDSIVLKALEKDRRNRYETASGLAEDIERYLNREPVLAQRRSSTYTMRKFVQRNKGLVASLATIFALLVAGIVGTTGMYLRASSETIRANESAARAKNEEKLRTAQLRAQLYKSAASDWENDNIQSAWQSLRRQTGQSPEGWVSRYLANEMRTWEPGESMRGHMHYVLTTDVSSRGDFVLSGGADDAVYLWNARTNEPIYRRLFRDMVARVRFSRDQQQFAVADRSNIVSLFDTVGGDLIRTLGPFKQDVSAMSFHPSRPVLALGFFGNDSYRDSSSRAMAFRENQPADLLIVDAQTGQTLQVIRGHQKEITGVKFDDTGNRLVTGCMDGMLRVWKSAASGKAGIGGKFELEKTVSAHPTGVRSIDLSRDGKRIVSGGNDQIASLWDADTGKLVSHLTGHASEVLGVAISPGGKQIATASNDHTARIWDLQGNPLATWKGHAGPINEIKFSFDGKQIITASDDVTLRRWDVEKSTASTTHDFGISSEVWRADFSPDKSMVATACESGNVTLLDARTGEVRKELPHDGAVLTLEWLDDGRLVTAGDDMGLWVWDRLEREGELAEPALKVALPFDLPETMVWDVSASPDGELLLVAATDKTARIVDTRSWKEVGVLRGHQEALTCARFSANGKQIVTSSDDQTVRVWDLASRKQRHCFVGHGHEVWRAIFSPADPNLIASSAVDGKIMLWNLSTGQALPTSLLGHKASVAGLTFTGDGRSLVSAGDDGTVRVWDVETGVELFVFQDQSSPFMIDATFSKDGQSLVTTGIGQVTVRHASSRFASPYLKHDAVADTIRWAVRVTEEASDAELEDAIAAAKKVIDHYPSHKAYANLGIAQCRLRRYAESMASLKEALRVQEIIFEESDKPLLAEGYLAIACAKTNNRRKAVEILKRFDDTAEYWSGDPKFQKLHNRIQAALDD